MLAVDFEKAFDKTRRELFCKKLRPGVGPGGRGGEKAVGFWQEGEQVSGEGGATCEGHCEYF